MNSLFTRLEGWYIDVQGAALWAEVTPSTIRKWIRQDVLPTVKIGGAHLILREDLETVMQLERKPGPKSLTPLK